MFGSDTSRTAEVFGPRFLPAMAFAWSELPTLDQGGPDADALVEAHRQAFVEAARDLEAADPSAYRTMQGKGAFSTRIPTGLLGWVLVGCLCFMTGIAAALVLVARLVGRGLVMALPVVIPSARSTGGRDPSARSAAWPRRWSSPSSPPPWPAGC